MVSTNLQQHRQKRLCVHSTGGQPIISGQRETKRDEPFAVCGCLALAFEAERGIWNIFGSIRFSVNIEISQNMPAVRHAPSPLVRFSVSMCRHVGCTTAVRNTISGRGSDLLRFPNYARCAPIFQQDYGRALHTLLGSEARRFRRAEVRY